MNTCKTRGQDVPRDSQWIQRRVIALLSATIVAGVQLVSEASLASPTGLVPRPSAATPSGSAGAAGARVARTRPDSLDILPIPGPLQNNGGPVQTAPKIYVVFWDWHSDPFGEKPYLINFLSSIGGTPWFTTTHQYSGAGTGNATNVFGGYWDDSTPIPAQPTEDQIQQEANRAMAHFALPNSVNIQIVVATPTGHTSSGIDAGTCSHHSPLSNAGVANVSYVNFPYNTDIPTCGTFILGGRLDGVGIIAGHEMAEAITDPLVNASTAWADDSGNEIGDKCIWYSERKVTTTLGTFVVQPLWSNLANGCVFSTEYPPSGVAAATDPESNNPYGFTIGGDGNLWANTWSGSAWKWENLGIPLNGSALGVQSLLGATAGAEGVSPTVFVSDDNNRVWLVGRLGYAWGWLALPSPESFLPLSVTASPDGTSAYVFGYAYTPALVLGVQVSTSGGGFGYENLGEPPSGIEIYIGATTANDGGYAYTVGSDFKVWVMHVNGSTHTWINLGNPLGHALFYGQFVGLVAANNGADPYFFFVTQDGKFRLNKRVGAKWVWEELSQPPGTRIGDSVGVVATDKGTMQHAFVIGDDGDLWTDAWDGHGWSWKNLGKPAGVSISGANFGVTVQNDKDMYVYVVGSDNNVWLDKWNGSVWSWKKLGNPQSWKNPTTF